MVDPGFILLITANDPIQQQAKKGIFEKAPGVIPGAV
jgi:hypothetical protein